MDSGHVVEHPSEKPPAARRTVGSAERRFDVALGQRIRTRRSLLGLSRVDLARSIGVSYQQIAKYESGMDRISIYRLVLIAVSLSMTVGDLVDDLAPVASAEAVRQAPQAEHRLLLHDYDRIEDDNLRHLLRELIRQMSNEPRQPPRAARDGGRFRDAAVAAPLTDKAA